MTQLGSAEVPSVGVVPIHGCQEGLVKDDKIRLTLGTSTRGLIGLHACKDADAGPTSARSMQRLSQPRSLPVLVQPNFASVAAEAQLLEPLHDERIAASVSRHAALQICTSYVEAISKYAHGQLHSSRASTRLVVTDPGRPSALVGGSWRCSSSCSRGPRVRPSQLKGCERHTRCLSQEAVLCGPAMYELAARGL